MAGTIAAMALALNPYAVSFGATAFTDPLLVLAGTLAMCLAVYGQAGAAGLFLGAAVMTKQQGCSLRRWSWVRCGRQPCAGAGAHRLARPCCG